MLLTNTLNRHTLIDMPNKSTKSAARSGYTPKRTSSVKVPVSAKKSAKKSTPHAKVSQVPAPPPKPAPVDRHSLPLVSILGRDDMRRAIEILKEDAEYMEQEQLVANARKEIKAEFVALCQRNDIPDGHGLRYGALSGIYKKMRARKLNKGRLMLEAGVTAKQLDACYDDGKEYYRVDIVDDTKPKKQKAAEDEE